MVGRRAEWSEQSGFAVGEPSLFPAAVDESPHLRTPDFSWRRLGTGGKLDSVAECLDSTADGEASADSRENVAGGWIGTESGAGCGSSGAGGGARIDAMLGGSGFCEVSGGEVEESDGWDVVKSGSGSI